MARNTKALFEQHKAERTSDMTFSDDEVSQARSFLKSRAKGTTKKGLVAVPASKPSERPEPAVDPGDTKGEEPGAKHASSIPVTIPEPIVVPPPVTDPEEVPAVDDAWDDDPLALVTGSSDLGLAEVREKHAGDDTIYSSKQPHPVALFNQLSRDFNRLEWTMWEPEAIVRAIAETTSSPPSDEVRNMIGALGSLVESEAFWNEYHVFLWTAQALNGEVPDMTILPELRPEEVAFAVGVANVVRDEEDIRLPNGETIDGVRFDDDILATIAAVFWNAGLVYVPEPIEGANEHLQRVQGPEANALAKAVKEKWEAVSEQDSPELDEDAVGFQVARLIDVRDYVRDPYAS